MIDTLPLDLFGDDDAPEREPREPGGPVAAACPWCAADVAPDAATCAACGARILPAEPPAPAAHDGICRWCGAAIAPEIDACPACSWDARGENQIEIPGLTTPLTEAEIRALYGGDDPEPEADIAAEIAIGLLGAFLPRG